jgi:hypothetical protein
MISASCYFRGKDTETAGPASSREEMDEIHLWGWRFTDENGKRRESSWHMTEPDVREYAHVYKDAEKVEGSLEIRTVRNQSTSDFRP